MIQSLWGSQISFFSFLEQKEKKEIKTLSTLFSKKSVQGVQGVQYPVYYPPLWRLVGCRRPPEIKLDVGVFWGDSELLLPQAQDKRDPLPAASATERRGQCGAVVLGALPAPIPGGAAAPDDYRMLA